MKLWKYRKVGYDGYMVENIQKMFDWISKIKPGENIEISCEEMSKEKWENLCENALFWGR